MWKIIRIILGTSFCWFCAFVFYVIGGLSQVVLFPPCAPNATADERAYCSSPPNPSGAVIAYTFAAGCFVLPLIIFAVVRFRNRTVARVTA
jgi:hypothetical protein